MYQRLPFSKVPRGSRLQPSLRNAGWTLVPSPLSGLTFALGAAVSWIKKSVADGTNVVISDPQRREEMLWKVASLGIQVLLLGRQPACEPHLTRRVQGAGPYRGPCHHPASSAGRSDRRTEPLPPRQLPPTPLAHV